MSDSFDAVQQISPESMRGRRVDDWWKVAAVLDQTCPGWDTRDPFSADAACAAIRDLASRAQSAQSKLDVIANYTITDPENQDAVNMAAVAREGSQAPARHTNSFSSTNPEQSQ